MGLRLPSPATCYPNFFGVVCGVFFVVRGDVIITESGWRYFLETTISSSITYTSQLRFRYLNSKQEYWNNWKTRNFNAFYKKRFPLLVMRALVYNFVTQTCPVEWIERGLLCLFSLPAPSGSIYKNQKSHHSILQSAHSLLFSHLSDQTLCLYFACYASFVVSIIYISSKQVNSGKFAAMRTRSRKSSSFHIQRDHISINVSTI